MNPIPILVKYFGHTLSDINRATGYSFKHIDQLHTAHNAERIDPLLHDQLFELSMVEWGEAYYKRTQRKARKLLWKVYFPDTRPHIYHLMHYTRGQDLAKPTEYSDRVIRRILHQPRLHRRQVDRIRRSVIEHCDAYSSKKRKYADPDPAVFGLYYALNDPKRLYNKDEIVTD